VAWIAVASWEVSCKILSNIFFSDLGERRLDFAAATSILAVGILCNPYYIRCWDQLPYMSTSQKLAIPKHGARGIWPLLCSDSQDTRSGVVYQIEEYLFTLYVIIICIGATAEPLTLPTGIIGKYIHALGCSVPDTGVGTWR
jgi:hypothetical protein